MYCPCCNKEMIVDTNWYSIGEDVGCPHCGEYSILRYQETFDPDSGTEYGWFYMEALQ